MGGRKLVTTLLYCGPNGGKRLLRSVGIYCSASLGPDKGEEGREGERRGLKQGALITAVATCRAQTCPNEAAREDETGRGREGRRFPARKFTHASRGCSFSRVPRDNRTSETVISQSRQLRPHRGPRTKRVRAIKSEADLSSVFDTFQRKIEIEIEIDVTVPMLDRVYFPRLIETVICVYRHLNQSRENKMSQDLFSFSFSLCFSFSLIFSNNLTIILRH